MFHMCWRAPRILSDTKNFLVQRHEDHFEALVHNNALVFEALDSRSDSLEGFKRL